MVQPSCEPMATRLLHPLSLARCRHHDSVDLVVWTAPNMLIQLSRRRNHMGYTLMRKGMIREHPRRSTTRGSISSSTHSDAKVTARSELSAPSESVGSTWFNPHVNQWQQDFCILSLSLARGPNQPMQTSWGIMTQKHANPAQPSEKSHGLRPHAKGNDSRASSPLNYTWVNQLFHPSGRKGYSKVRTQRTQ